MKEEQDIEGETQIQKGKWSLGELFGVIFAVVVLIWLMAVITIAIAAAKTVP